MTPSDGFEEGTPQVNNLSQGRIVSITEKVIENQILTYLANKKIFAWKN
ncbi:MAG: hypothetical protein RLZ35_215, partial [Pseudomonadota bacterium]